VWCVGDCSGKDSNDKRYRHLEHTSKNWRLEEEKNSDLEVTTRNKEDIHYTFRISDIFGMGEKITTIESDGREVVSLKGNQ
jgi:hypothetical protein